MAAGNVASRFAIGDGRPRGVNAETRKFRELCRAKTPTALKLLLDTIEDKEAHIKLRWTALNTSSTRAMAKHPTSSPSVKGIASLKPSAWVSWMP